MSQVSVRGNRDFQRLWAGLTISQLGSAVGSVALPVVAVEVLKASAFEVSELTALAAVTVAISAFPLGSYVEFKRKRPVMIIADVARCLTLLSVPAAAMFGLLTFAQLCVVAAVNSACQLAFASASQANLKHLVSPEGLIDANSRLQATQWMSLVLGSSLGGWLISVFSALGTMTIDAVSFIADAFTIRSIRKSEPAPPDRSQERNRRAELMGGLAFVRHNRVLRRMLISWIVFAGANTMSGPVLIVFYLRVLHFSSWRYGLLMGVPSLAAMFGSRLSKRIAGRIGPVRTIRWASLLRGPWYFLTPLARPGTLGLLICGIAFAGLLFFAAMTNSAMASYRQLRTPNSLMVRVATLWSFSTSASAPLFALLGGLTATVLGVRPAIFLTAGCMCVAAIFLPRADERAEPATEAADEPAVTA